MIRTGKHYDVYHDDPNFGVVNIWVVYTVLKINSASLLLQSNVVTPFGDIIISNMSSTYPQPCMAFSCYVGQYRLGCRPHFYF